MTAPTVDDAARMLADPTAYTDEAALHAALTHLRAEALEGVAHLIGRQPRAGRDAIAAQGTARLRECSIDGYLDLDVGFGRHRHPLPKAAILPQAPSVRFLPAPAFYRADAGTDNGEGRLRRRRIACSDVT